jgi:hypothetical protein
MPVKTILTDTGLLLYVPIRGYVASMHVALHALSRKALRLPARRSGRGFLLGAETWRTAVS